MKVSFKFEGGSELASVLAELSTRVQRKVMREVLAEAAEPIRRAAARNAERSSEAPHIGDNIVISVPSSSIYLDVRNETAAVAIGPKGGKEGFGYGVPLEVGTAHSSARPFMRPAFDTTVDESLRIVGEATWRELAGRGIQRPSTSVDVHVQDEV